MILWDVLIDVLLTWKFSENQTLEKWLNQFNLFGILLTTSSIYKKKRQWCDQSTTLRHSRLVRHTTNWSTCFWSTIQRRCHHYIEHHIATTWHRRIRIPYHALRGTLIYHHGGIKWKASHIALGEVHCLLLPCGDLKIGVSFQTKAWIWRGYNQDAVVFEVLRYKPAMIKSTTQMYMFTFMRSLQYVLLTSTVHVLELPPVKT